MTVIRGFLFDLDGTLVDTHESNFGAYKEAITYILGVTPTNSGDLKKLIVSGESSKDFLPKVISGITSEQVDAINAHKKNVYPDHLISSTLNSFLISFLNGVSKSHKTVLVTTAKKDNAIAVLKHHNIENIFDHKIFGDDVKNMKPNPEAYLRALELTGLHSEEVIAFEDSSKGMAAASAAGIRVVEIKEFNK